MRFYKVDLLLSENFEEFERLFDYADDKENGLHYDEDLGEYIEFEDCDVTKEITRLWTMVNLEKDPLTQRVMEHLLENNGWYDPVLF